LEVTVDVALQPFVIYVMLVAGTCKTSSFAPGLVSVTVCLSDLKNKHISLFTKWILVLAPYLSLQ
jgi:hypothetical protein